MKYYHLMIDPFSEVFCNFAYFWLNIVNNNSNVVFQFLSRLETINIDYPLPGSQLPLFCEILLEIYHAIAQLFHPMCSRFVENKGPSSP